jgi:hypothetical protein
VRLRAAIATQLNLLVRGELPELLTQVRHYGPNGASLVAQPDEIWTHREIRCHSDDLWRLACRGAPMDKRGISK